MSRPVLRYRIPLLVGCLPLFALSAQQKRAFEPGGPESLVQAGSMTHTRPEVQVVMTNFSFTTDRSGKLIDAGGDARKDTVQVAVYEVQLFVDESGVREALVPLAGEEFWQLSNKGAIQEAVRKGAFPKLVVLRFSKPQKARAIRENLASELSKYPGGSGGEAGRFTSYLRKDFAEGDEVEIRIAPDGMVRTTVKGNAQKDIASPEFADALLSVWLMKAPGMVRNLRTFVPPKPGG
jgi:hypothetical protein